MLACLRADGNFGASRQKGCPIPDSELANCLLTISSDYPFMAWHDNWRAIKLTTFSICKGISGFMKGIFAPPLPLNAPA